MPYIGLTPFLPQNRINSLKMSVECVNALYRAYSISTKTKKTDYASIKLVSMPYIGLTPFLLVRIARELGYRVQVSMPYIGLTPFLLTDCEHDDIISHEEVSMPYIGLTPFLLMRIVLALSN